MAPGRWDPSPSNYPSLQLPQAKGPFEQPPDSWGGQGFNGGGGGGGGGGMGGGGAGGGGGGRGRPPAGRSHLQQQSTRRGSDASDLRSTFADHSLAESLAPTIDTANLEHIAEQLVSSDELMRVIARRLGLPESQVVPADELSSVFSVSTTSQSVSRTGPRDTQEALLAPRDDWADDLDEPEFDSDDDLWSDEEHERQW
ncbi:hypothetical protein B484DRAFT_411345 [Ochromonadaceae sp. CCMP2298]|nr:hypothetical protein B484DRAFT_411345 [Ochromonadaceae sp. CCMP2298]